MLCSIDCGESAELAAGTTGPSTTWFTTLWGLRLVQAALPDYSSKVLYGQGPVAQGIEQWFPKPCVVGSNPIGAAVQTASDRGNPPQSRFPGRIELYWTAP